MRRGILNITLKAILYYRKQVAYQFLIILLLCAVITGSLMTGSSVRASLRRTSLEKLGNTGIYISSGLRYFDRNLPGKLSRNTRLRCTGLLELKGSSQGLISQKSANHTSIYAVENDFFSFHGIDSVSINSGEIIVNNKLATILGVREGDDVIIRFSNISDIPADAPFAPESGENTSIVLKVGKIIDAAMMGNFSLSISQVAPLNIFLDISDLESYTGKKSKINRMLVERGGSNTEELNAALGKALDIADVGMNIRKTKSGENELISDRVFIDEELVNEIRNRVPSASPVITYLANRIESSGSANPYSFVAAIPPDIYTEAPSGEGIIINSWLSEDLKATKGDSVRLTWYSPDSLNHLVEKSGTFIIRDVAEFNGIWSDSTLMPEFPGISGSESCSDWDAGIPVQTNLIRDKDEDYWDRYKGTPKAFLNYQTGKKLWGSNYGPATAIRFPASMTPDEINEKLAGSLPPDILGFTVNDVYNESIKAAGESVDFGTLFLSLGFFLILASFVLLSFAVSYYFDLRKNEIRVLYSLGFRNRLINRILLSETSVTTFLACVLGSIAGYFVNILLILALNSVWTGAVQTNTLIPAFDVSSVIAGFFSTLLITIIFMFVKSRDYLKKLAIIGTKNYSAPSSKRNMLLLVITFAVTLLLLVSSLFSEEGITLSFIAGSFFLVSFILFWRQFFIQGKRQPKLSRLYYSFYPSYAITPVLFIAAGIFAVFITAVNRKNFDPALNNNASGTGGYLLWMETSVPVTDDLNSRRGIQALGLDEDSLSGMKFIQMKQSPGNDASCLNLNHITAPPLLGVDPGSFIKDNSFSFTKTILKDKSLNPWTLLEDAPADGVIYGIADQTVLDWGLKIGVGDTIILRAENGQPLKIVIAAGLQSSVFQGNILTGKQDFTRYYPSVSGNSIFLIDGETDRAGMYSVVLNERLSAYGASIENTSDRLEGFYEITNTYLSVFGVFGGLGMITGIAGLGFVLMRNYNRRKREFALMIATGFTPKKIRKSVFSEQLMILFAGVVSGVIPAIVATLPSLRSNHEIPWIYLSVIVLAIFFTGLLAVMLSLRSIREKNLITALRKD